MVVADRFWKFFWIGSGGITVLGLLIALSLFIFYARQGDLLAAVGVSYEPGKDPFESAFMGGGEKSAGGVVLPAGFLYQNSLPLRFSSWTWEGRADWRSAEAPFEGTYALKATILAPGGTIGMSGPAINVKDRNSVSLVVRADNSVEDVFIDLYDKNGNALTMQSLGWYTASSKLTPGTWERVDIPLKNFGAGALSTVSGFSISAKKPGVVYLDVVEFSKKVIAHEAWVAPPEAAGQGPNPFASATPVALPYTFSPTSESLPRWYTYYGRFAPGGTGEMQLGPSVENKTTGSMTIFRGGRAWSDYRADVAINWGQVSVFSLLARFVSDGDFVSCAFSRYGESVQIYQMIKGTSNFISQTPPLAVRDSEPWANVKMGVEVKGNRVACSIDGNEVLAANLPSLSPQGTVGFETWDPNSQAAPHTLHSFVAEPLTGK